MVCRSFNIRWTSMSAVPFTAARLAPIARCSSHSRGDDILSPTHTYVVHLYSLPLAKYTSTGWGYLSVGEDWMSNQFTDDPTGT